MSTEIDLISRLSAAIGPSRELDEEIALANGWTRVLEPSLLGPDYWRSPTGQICPNVPLYTESINAALTLVPEGYGWRLDTTSTIPELKTLVIGQSTIASCIWKTEGVGKLKKHVVGTSATPAIALVIACLKAKEDIRFMKERRK